MKGMIVLALAFSGVISGAAESLDVDELIGRVSTAWQEVSFQGIFVQNSLHAGREMEFVMEIYRWAPDRYLIRFLSPDSVAGTVVAVRRDEVRFRGDAHIGRAFRHRRADRWLKGTALFREIDRLQQNYNIQISERINAIGRPVYALSIRSKRPNRPEVDLEIDRESALILKVVRRSPVARTPRTYHYRSIRIGPPDTLIFHRAWKETQPAAGKADWKSGKRRMETYPTLVSLLARHQGTVLVPEEVPKGFVLQTIRRIQRQNRRFIHMLYSDGLTFISLFQRDASWRSESRRHGRKAASFYSVIRGKQAGMAYSLVGEIPEDELEQMARSLVPLKRAASERVSLTFIGPAVLLAVLIWYWYQKRKSHNI